VCSFLAEALVPLAAFWSWVPNLIFTGIGLTRLRRAAMV
jgi:lipopolysaccharide export LptBFGC system permease protein LptF